MLISVRFNSYNHTIKITIQRNVDIMHNQRNYSKKYGYNAYPLTCKSCVKNIKCSAIKNVFN